MRIAIIGKFKRMHDEEYIARSFEALGHQVQRIPESTSINDTRNILHLIKPNIILYCKWIAPEELKPDIEILRRSGTKTVCWLFDLYFNYQREHLVKSRSFFKSDYVFTTDGGHDKEFEKLGINHKCLRQGIYKDECILLPFRSIKYLLVFVGSDNPIYPERTALVKKLTATWFGAKDTNEIRGMNLNALYSESGIVIGDSYYSPNYWSNRVVETLGRGGFLIHQDVPGIHQEFPYLITYERGNLTDLKAKIEYYLSHEDERKALIQKNFEWVRNSYTMENQCAKLIKLCQT